MTEQFREYLKKQQYGYVRSNLAHAEIWMRKDEQQARAIVFLQQVRQERYEPDAIRDIHFQVQRKLYLESIRDVDVLVCVLTEEPEKERELAQLGIPVWVLDILKRRVILFENQSDDFDGLFRPLEDALEHIGGTTNKQSLRPEMIPFITVLLAAVNLIVFFLMEWFGSTENVTFMLQYGALEWHLVLEQGQFWRLFSSMFLHFGAAHIANNMIVLALAGSRLEQQIGHLRYLFYYLISGLAASAASVIWFMMTDGNAVSAGASGAIYGVLGALVVLTLRQRKKLGRDIVRRCAWMVFLLIYGSVTQPQVDYIAHIAGMVAGAALMTVSLILTKLEGKSN